MTATCDSQIIRYCVCVTRKEETPFLIEFWFFFYGSFSLLHSCVYGWQAKDSRWQFDWRRHMMTVDTCHRDIPSSYIHHPDGLSTVHFSPCRSQSVAWFLDFATLFKQWIYFFLHLPRSELLLHGSILQQISLLSFQPCWLYQILPLSNFLKSVLCDCIVLRYALWLYSSPDHLWQAWSCLGTAEICKTCNLATGCEFNWCIKDSWSCAYGCEQ